MKVQQKWSHFWARKLRSGGLLPVFISKALGHPSPHDFRNSLAISELRWLSWDCYNRDHSVHHKGQKDSIQTERRGRDSVSPRGKNTTTVTGTRNQEGDQRFGTSYWGKRDSSPTLGTSTLRLYTGETRFLITWLCYPGGLHPG